jgi:hypothetical protein
MPNRSFPAVEALVGQVRPVAAGRSDPGRILVQTISMACPVGADPYAVLGCWLVEGAV